MVDHLDNPAVGIGRVDHHTAEDIVVVDLADLRHTHAVVEARHNLPVARRTRAVGAGNCSLAEGEDIGLGCTASGTEEGSRRAAAAMLEAG